MNITQGQNVLNAQMTPTPSSTPTLLPLSWVLLDISMTHPGNSQYVKNPVISISITNPNPQTVTGHFQVRSTYTDKIHLGAQNGITEPFNVTVPGNSTIEYEYTAHGSLQYLEAAQGWNQVWLEDMDTGEKSAWQLFT